MAIFDHSQNISWAHVFQCSSKPSRRIGSRIGRPLYPKKATPVHSIKFIHNRRTIRQFEPVAFDTPFHSLKFTLTDLHFDFLSLVVTAQPEQRCFSTFNSHVARNVRKNLIQKSAVFVGPCLSGQTTDEITLEV
jgi:hypothetical protein